MKIQCLPKRQNLANSGVRQMYGEHVQLVMEQFKQAHENHRHYDRMAWMMVSILSPVSLGVFAYAATYTAKDNADRYVLIALAIVSIITLILMRIMYGRMSYYQDHRSRPFIHRIEREFLGYHFFQPKQPVRYQYPNYKTILNCRILRWIRRMFRWHFLMSLCQWVRGTQCWRCFGECRCYLRRNIFTIRKALDVLVLAYIGAWIALLCIA